MNFISSAFRTNVYPNVNVPHFKSQLKNIRNENITFYSALNDMIDNVVGLANVNSENYDLKMNFILSREKVYKIEISDNVSHGFKDIVKNGEENPFNMGHTRDGHNDDKEMSEFGIGMKKTLIFLCEKATVYTRCVNDDDVVEYYRLELDFVEMEKRKDPSQSYNFTSFESISRDKFIDKKGDDIGSLIVLENIRPKGVGEPSLTSPSEENKFLRKIRENIGTTFRHIIGDSIDIYVNGEKVEPSIDVKTKIEDKVTMEMYVNLEKNIVYMNKNEKWFLFNKDTNRYNICKKNPHLTDDEEAYIHFTMFSGYVKTDAYNNRKKDQKKKDDNMHRGDTEMIRNKRSFGTIEITKRKTDGYSNYIYSSIEWETKLLNPVLGLASNKTIKPKENEIYRAIQKALQTEEGVFRTMYKEDMKKWKEQNITDDEETDTDEDTEDDEVIYPSKFMIKKEPVIEQEEIYVENTPVIEQEEIYVENTPVVEQEEIYVENTPVVEQEEPGIKEDKIEDEILDKFLNANNNIKQNVLFHLLKDKSRDELEYILTMLN